MTGVQTCALPIFYEEDSFEVMLGSEKSIRHIPYLGGDRGKLIAVYAVANYTSGAQEIEVMSKTEVDVVRGSSKSGNSGPWCTSYNAMARKTVLRRICKYIPRAIDAQRAVGAEESLDAGITETSDYIDIGDFEEVDTSPKTEAETRKGKAQGMTSQLKAAIKSNSGNT